MSHAIELIYDSDCPNVEAAREALRLGLSAVGLPAKWTEWVRGSPDAPEHAERYGSPTVLVDGRDILEDAGIEASACRLYRNESGELAPAPSPDAIARRLRNRVGGAA